MFVTNWQIYFVFSRYFSIQKKISIIEAVLGTVFKKKLENFYLKSYNMSQIQENLLRLL